MEAERCGPCSISVSTFRKCVLNCCNYEKGLASVLNQNWRCFSICNTVQKMGSTELFAYILIVGCFLKGERRFQYVMKVNS